MLDVLIHPKQHAIIACPEPMPASPAPPQGFNTAYFRPLGQTPMIWLAPVLGWPTGAPESPSWRPPYPESRTLSCYDIKCHKVKHARLTRQPVRHNQFSLDSLLARPDFPEAPCADGKAPRRSLCRSVCFQGYGPTIVFVNAAYDNAFCGVEAVGRSSPHQERYFLPRKLTQRIGALPGNRFVTPQDLAT